MTRNRFFKSSFLRMGLKLLALEAVVVLLAWLLFQRVGGQTSYRFSDTLFLLGALELMAASVGMLGHPYHSGGSSRYGAPEFAVRATEEEERHQALVDLIQQKSFATLLVVSGLLTMLGGLCLNYLFH